MKTNLNVFFCLILSIKLIKLGDGLTCNDGYVSNNGTSCDECGLTDVTPNIKIVGGSTANAHSWPAQAFIVQTYKGTHTINGRAVTLSETTMCGGTVINAYTILTAAHCVSNTFDFTSGGTTYTATMSFTDNPYYKSLESTLKVYLGAQDISFFYSSTDPSSPITTYSVSAIKTHPQYDSNFLNDISLLQLSSHIVFDTNVKPACLPSSSNSYPIPYPNKITGYVAGWGTLSSGGSSPTLLNNVNLTIYNFSSCSSVARTLMKNESTQICAGELAGGKDTCQGDSGGGMYILDTFGGKSRYMVVGITSYGVGCGNVLSPSLYTRVSYYVDWIKSNWKETGGGSVLAKNTISVFAALVGAHMLILWLSNNHNGYFS